MANNWTEDDVKRATLRYLKGYYRHRPRKGETSASIDMRGEGGIIADGYLSFVRDDNTFFSATFEATSYHSREELNYSPLGIKLFLDGFAVSALMTAGLFALLHYNKFYVLLEIGWFWTIASILSTIGLFVLVYKYFFKKFSISRYRYIYAIEQFKNYYADEQWISFASDVFPNLKDKYFRELKRQCLRNGFGLIRLDEDLEPRLLATPSRVEVSNFRRRIVSFFSKEEVQNRLRIPQTGQWFERLIPKLTGNKTRDILRFQKLPLNQMAIVGFGLIILATLLGVQMMNGPVIYVNEQDYAKKVLAEKKQKESRTYLIDTPTEPGVLPENEKSFHDHSTKIDLKSRYEQDTIEEEEPAFEPPLSAPRDILIRSGKNSDLLYYDCSRLPKGDSIRYIVEDTLVLNLNDARNRVNLLGDADFNVTAIWRGCYSEIKAGYLVYFGQLYPDSLTAATEILYLETAISSRKLSSRLRARQFR
ncbi:MAG: hypothetical protein DHS20C18_15350 [Saprospiraceae bacterium]|nr:MAG: hypothetical protein DHS20C18_15350 [Saprospiraceae bacterium]